MSKITYTQTITIENDDQVKVVDAKDIQGQFYNVINNLIQEFNTQSATIVAEMKSQVKNLEVLNKLAAKYTPILATNYTNLVKKYSVELNKFPLEYKSKINEAITNAKNSGTDTDMFVAIHKKVEATYAQKSQAQKASKASDSVVMLKSTDSNLMN